MITWDRWARFEPHDGFRVNFAIEFDHPVIQSHSCRADLEFSTTSYLKEIARARTFGFMRDIEYLRQRSEERRVGKESRSRSGTDAESKRTARGGDSTT